MVTKNENISGVSKITTGGNEIILSIKIVNKSPSVIIEDDFSQMLFNEEKKRKAKEV